MTARQLGELELLTLTASRSKREDHVEPLKPFYLDLDADEILSIQDTLGEILRSGQLILGKFTEEFESEFAKFVGCRYGVAVNTGTSALEILLRLRDVRGQKVAVASNTNFASVMAIIHAGGIPVFMDMTADFFVPNLDVLKATARAHKLKGVMWVHIGGIISPDFGEISEFCRSEGLFLIEDAAHAHGSRLGGTNAGAFADGGAFSFFPTKVMTTMEGGMITTNNEDDAALAKSYRNQGKRHAAYGGMHYDPGNSWRISEIAAYIGLVQLAKIERMISSRQEAVNVLIRRFEGTRIAYCDTTHMDRASQYKFIIRLPEGITAEHAKSSLAEKKIFCGGGVYEQACHQQPVFQNVTDGRDTLVVTEQWCPRHICPPITSGTTVDDAHRMADAIIELLA
jgi:dTDP-4-amino-4,6-dideoxygalactose transaminase